MASIDDTTMIPPSSFGGGEKVTTSSSTHDEDERPSPPPTWNVFVEEIKGAIPAMIATLLTMSVLTVPVFLAITYCTVVCFSAHREQLRKLYRGILGVLCSVICVLNFLNWKSLDCVWSGDFWCNYKPIGLCAAGAGAVLWLLYSITPFCIPHRDDTATTATSYPFLLRILVGQPEEGTTSGSQEEETEMSAKMIEEEDTADNKEGTDTMMKATMV